MPAHLRSSVLLLVGALVVFSVTATLLRKTGADRRLFRFVQ